MSLRPEYSLGHSEFNGFLFAVVGEENSGAQLTVLSALARLGLDPWKEAARLSGLTKQAATNALAATIHSLPEGNWKASDIPSIAARLVNRLPKHASPVPKSSPNRNVGTRKPTSEARKRLLWIGLSLTVLAVLSRLFGS